MVSDIRGRSISGCYRFAFLARLAFLVDLLAFAFLAAFLTVFLADFFLGDFLFLAGSATAAVTMPSISSTRSITPLDFGAIAVLLVECR